MKNLSKFMSLVLRHKPEKIGITLNSSGWVDVESFLDGIRKEKYYELCTIDDIEKVVSEDSKGRYSLKDGMIRANQGHSIKIDLKLKSKIPPPKLYHGTPEKFLKSIKKNGLKPMNRHHVHLSSDIETAKNVGERRGKSTVIEIDTMSMVRDNIKFYQSDNGVWLTDEVNPKYLIIGVL